uniref:Uncharacterized protein AlNc14C96G5879 n=1 Tax=Albugo laibachii Nc14 TaxID=890382 RepID=F0WH04_9STRA|nr:conserved hypothetical protein [Albugo laibachii Nc14]|eukprot:CCA20519.1 conserved hypothetical protein [Albugo laibachii Nc14]
MTAPVPLSGYLYKLKSHDTLLSPQWNRRYFALEGSDLKYYNNESASQASKTIDLLSIDSIRQFETGDHGVFSFVIKLPSRSYFLRAESKGDMRRWVRGLLEQQELWREAATRGNGEQAKRKPKHYSDHYADQVPRVRA